MIKKLTPTLALLALAPLCAHAADTTNTPWSVRMADSILTRQPKARLIENSTNRSPAWSYSTALAVYAIAKVGIQTGDDKYLQYARDYADEFVDANGNIDPAKYKPDTFKLDDLAPGRLLMLLSAQKPVEIAPKPPQNSTELHQNTLTQAKSTPKPYKNCSIRYRINPETQTEASGIRRFIRIKCGSTEFSWPAPSSRSLARPFIAPN